MAEWTFAGSFGPGHAGHDETQWNWMAVTRIRLLRTPPPGTTLGGPIMISRADVEKLRTIRAPEPAILSLYLPVPLDPAQLRELPARAGELMASAVSEAAAQVSRADRDAVQQLVAAGGRNWLGHTVAIFSCGELGLLEALPLPGWVAERAVLATRPHVRPILAAIQRCPAYRVAVIDRRDGWLLSIVGDSVETIELPAADGIRSPGFGGWYGLESHRAQQRVTELARHPYQDVAAVLEREARAGDHRPLVLGGHPEGITQLLSLLPEHLLEQYAGSFAAGPNTLTTARARELAGTVIASWAARREEQLAAETLTAAVRRNDAVVGLPPCLAAVNAGAVGMLLIPDEGLVPGFVCGRCGAVSLTGDDCPDWGAAAGAVPDLLEEMAARVLDDNGQVIAVHGPSWAVAARLRFPVPQG
jgi:Bacterial archaeo-eukaryotic release factor family 10